MIKTKLIAARKKLYTQEKMANLLHMSQSQYHRREKGEIVISDEEWERMAKILNTSIEEIKEIDFCGQTSDEEKLFDSSYSSNNYFYNMLDFVLNNQQDYINLLKEKIESLQQEVNLLKKQK